MPLDEAKKIAERLKLLTDHMFQLITSMGSSFDDGPPISNNRLDLYRQRINDAIAIILQQKELIDHNRVWNESILCAANGTKLSARYADELKRLGEPMALLAVKRVIDARDKAQAEAFEFGKIAVTARRWYRNLREVDPELHERLRVGKMTLVRDFFSLEADLVALELTNEDPEPYATPD